jgi:hypothetical protein
MRCRKRRLSDFARRPSTSYTNTLKKQGTADYAYADTNMSDYEEDHFFRALRWVYLSKCDWFKTPRTTTLGECA